MTTIVTSDLLEPRVLEDPHPLLHRLRREAPVHWAPSLGAWLLTRHADVTAAFRDPRLSARRAEILVAMQAGERGRALTRDLVRVLGGSMLMQDGADHARLRRLGNPAFVTAALAGLRPMLERVVDALLDRVAPRRRMDFVRELAAPFPALAIAEMLGVPGEDRERFQRWSEDAARFFGGTLRDPLADARAANEGIVELEAYFLRLLAERRRRPGADLLSLLLEGQAEGRLSESELVAQCVLILAAGHVTTIDQLANTLHTLLAHPDEFRRLLDDPTLLPGAVEECLRFSNAVPFMHRLAREDIELGGKVIRRGDVVFLGLSAANRDPEVFEDPDRFDITRPLHRHVAFGFGPHACLGAGLARREIEVAMAAVLRRMPGVRLAPDEAAVRRCESLVFLGFHNLPIVF